jgi:hypothetical protein
MSLFYHGKIVSPVETEEYRENFGLTDIRTVYLRTRAQRLETAAICLVLTEVGM